MSKRSVVGVVLALALMVPAYARAHEGHAHKVLGTITASQDNRLEVKTREGKTVTIVLNEKTTIVRGKEKLDAGALKAGERVVVDVGTGKEPITAREVKLGTAARTTGGKQQN
jgi:hypothetical protein